MDWKQIKAEYIAGGTSYRKLAEKYSVPRTTLERRAKVEKWAALRRQAYGRAEAKMVDAIGNDAAKKATNIIDVADKLLDRIESVIPFINDTQGIKHISSALKDIKDIKGIKSSADMREQEARIRNLERQAEADQADLGIEVTISAEAEEYSG